MLFSSYEFLFGFLPVTWTVHALLRGVGLQRTSLLWLLIASVFFYGWWDPRYVPLIAGSMVCNYALGRKIAASARPKTWMAGGITLNLALLAYFKYARFFVDTLAAATEIEPRMSTIVLPLAISFFTFQQIAYLVDAKDGVERDPLSYALFVTFFPQLIAGPIVHHAEMMPQFSRGARLSPDKLVGGLTLLVLGLFKKVVIADGLSPAVAACFGPADAGQAVDATLAWQGALAYTFQLYFDFSGYTDMARGAAKLFGIDLPLNFDSPYKARNIAEFWRRWHMTLSRFLRDYLYIPLGGNRRGKARRYRNLMLTMLLGGLWHGAGWNFVIWGGLHGLYLVVQHGFEALHRRLRAPQARDTLGDSELAWIGRSVSTLVTFAVVVVAWVFFRATTFTGALAVLSAMATPPTTTDVHTWIVLLGLMGTVWCAPNSQQIAGWATTREFTLSLKPALWGLVLGVLAWISVLHLNRASEFLYFQF